MANWFNMLLSDEIIEALTVGIRHRAIIESKPDAKPYSNQKKKNAKYIQ